MKAVIAFLLGLAAVGYGRESKEALSMSSDSADADAESYGGLNINVFLNSGEEDYIQIALSSDLQKGSRSKYCLNIERIFEATGYQLNNTDGTKCTEDCDYTEVDGSTIEIGDAGCNVTAVDSTTFKVECDAIGEGLTLTFKYVEFEGDSGLEYTIQLDGYTFVSSDEKAVLVLEQSLEDCTEDRGSADGDDDDEDDEEDEEDTDSEESTTTAEPDRRRLEEESGDDDDSEESSDSDEVSFNVARFKLTDTVGTDTCDDGTTSDLNIQLVYQSGTSQIQVVVPRFECDLTIDPFVGLKTSLLLGDGVNRAASIVCFIVMGVMALFV